MDRLYSLYVDLLINRTNFKTYKSFYLESFYKKSYEHSINKLVSNLIQLHSVYINMLDISSTMNVFKLSIQNKYIFSNTNSIFANEFFEINTSNLVYYNHNFYDILILLCVNLAKLITIKYSNVSIPKSISKYTVLRSPIGNKKSREQFEIRTYKRVFSSNIKSNYFLYLYSKLINKQYSLVKFIDYSNNY